MMLTKAGNKKCAPCVLVLSILVCVAGCREDVPVRGHVASPGEFALYSVTREQDDTHIIPVTAKDGAIWYREEACGLDLRHIDMAGVYAAVGAKGAGGSVFIKVKPEHYESQSSWSRARIGQSIAFVFRGKIVGQIERLPCEMRGSPCVETATWDEAERLVAELKSYWGP